MRHVICLLLLAAGLFLPTMALAQAPPQAPQAPAQQSPQIPSAIEALAKALDRPLDALTGRLKTFTLEVSVQTSAEPGKLYKFTVIRASDHAFAFAAADTPLGSLAVVRTEAATALIDHTHKRVFLGQGHRPTKDALEPDELIQRLAMAHGDVALPLTLAMQATDGRMLAMQLAGLLKLVEEPAGEGAITLKSGAAIAGRTVTLTVVPAESRLSNIEWTADQESGRLLYSLTAAAELPAIPQEGYEQIAVDRAELERTLARGLPRALEIYYRRGHPRQPADGERTEPASGVAEGEPAGVLRVEAGRRVCVLAGGPADLGRQHGKLLAREVRRNIDAVLYAMGLYESLREGRWFCGKLRQAWTAAAPHVPEEYKAEMAALGEASGVSLEEIQLANIVPELMRGSGFVVMGKATIGGALYHGCVLDYATGFGLQGEAVVFVVKKTGATPLVSVGYAGFVGSVSGMNDRQIALSEIGGAGGPRDGVPATILARQVLERARSLDEAVKILQESKPAGESVCVVSDGKIPDARAVALEVLRPGAKSVHFPEPVEDALLVSSGAHYKALVERTRAAWGKITPQTCKTMLDRPVASPGANLRNVLFMPQSLVFFVAAAGGKTDACQEAYVRYDLKELLKIGASAAAEK